MSNLDREEPQRSVSENERASRPKRPRARARTSAAQAVDAPRDRAVSETAVNISSSSELRPREDRRSHDEEAVRARAYLLYLARGADNGDPVQDWLQAEEELQREAPRAQQRDDQGSVYP
jgi:hypothetical protein